MNAKAPELLIVGASTRAAAWSARRAGFAPVCADAFADEDLRQVAVTRPVSNYPYGLVRAARSVSVCPWMYTGALENHPALVERLSAGRPLDGNPADVLRRVRDPFRVYELLKQNSLPALSVRPPHAPPPADGEWLLKPRRSAAGRGISVWLGEDAGRSVPGPGRKKFYFQQRAAGISRSGLFLGMPGRIELLGVSEQWIGATGPGGSPFGYCGSLVPAAVSPAASMQIRSVGEVLGLAFGLRGLFGCDFVCDSGTAWLVEVNPRYTASVEVFERAFDVEMLGWHCRSCRAFESRDRGLKHRVEEDLDRGLAVLAERPGRVFGKRIVYAPRELSAPRLRSVRMTRTGCQWPDVADIPIAGTRIGPGQPICTVFAEAEDSATCRALLDRRAAEVVVSGSSRTGCS